MGKYMNKAKPSAEVALMEQSALGVCTRARAAAADPSSYLQLRSRRLEKSPPPVPKPKDAPCPTPTATRDAPLASEKVGERSRNIRETTPSSLIRDSETISTPGSTTRTTTSNATNRRTQDLMNRSIPTSSEMEEFFSGAEQLQQRIFTEKYNFDPVNDLPLPGRYEWVTMDYQERAT